MHPTNWNFVVSLSIIATNDEQSKHAQIHFYQWLANLGFGGKFSHLL
jgi:hypothetical protein